MSDEIVDYSWTTFEGHRYFQIHFESGWIFWFLGLCCQFCTSHYPTRFLDLLPNPTLRLSSADWPNHDTVQYTGWEIYNETMYRVVTYSSAANWVGWKEWNLGCQNHDLFFYPNHMDISDFCKHSG